MTSTLSAPFAAMLGAVAAVGAIGSRGPSAVERLIPAAPGGPGRELLERMGSLGLVRRLVAADRLRNLAGRAAWPTPVERVCGGVCVAAAAIVAGSLPLGWPAVGASAFLAFGVARAPILVAGRAARRRLRAAERDVPLLLDALSLASFAGLPAQSALRKAVGVLDGPLADELSAALADVELGARWRDRLRELAGDLPIPDLVRAVTLLTRTESIGAGYAEPVSILADEVRASRRALATERARKAPVKMLFPLVFLVLPAFLLLTVVPVLVATLGSIR